MKVAIVAESFLPHFNGVTNSILKTLDHIALTGHDAVVITPAGSLAGELTGHGVPRQYKGFAIRTVPSMPLASYPEVRVATTSVSRIRKILARERVDVVHLASPFILGWQGLRAAQELNLPTVALYQTEVPSYAERYKMPWLTQRLWDHVRAIHTAADLSLVPSTFSYRQLQELGIDRLKISGRGVDTEQFTPRRRNEQFRQAVAPNGEIIIGYVGRLAAEKQVADLKALADLKNTRLVIVGSGPLESELRALLPAAHFTGFLSGERLAEVMASMDVFVHPGASETFCQTIQEAMACSVPVVAVGRGGPLDLVDSSRTGWLYQPGNLNELRNRVSDLVYDDAKRLAFASAALTSVQDRSWFSIGEQLLDHYREVRMARVSR
ncbi:glycosyltransferase family 4 protein [Arthrobacter sp. NIO-1057]|uniref:glycosyltransferase family 4 protein n=1 Tax=Arthrobacter sp. NIO-1057 TaxID=993071 RepID=UPI00071CD661|nr:glycosyltransferase family 1 protein [Arthrobacter sp. NIO-1057]KSU65185.1 alpha-mannosyltransferase [Arthrobacter sp. NIO-1057]